MSASNVCPHCYGSGETERDGACAFCNGTGQQPASIAAGKMAPVQPEGGAMDIMDDGALEATFTLIERWSELDLPLCNPLRMHCKALQSALEAAQQRIRDLEHQLAVRSVS